MTNFVRHLECGSIEWSQPLNGDGDGDDGERQEARWHQWISHANKRAQGKYMCAYIYSGVICIYIWTQPPA